MERDELVRRLKAKKFKLSEHITSGMVKRAQHMCSTIKEYKVENGSPLCTTNSDRLFGFIAEEIIANILGAKINDTRETNQYHWDMSIGDKVLELKTQKGIFGNDRQPMEFVPANVWHLEENQRYKEIDYLLVCRVSFDPITFIPMTLAFPKSDPNFKFVDTVNRLYNPYGPFKPVPFRTVHHSADFEILGDR